MKSKDNTILITGGSSGIGLELADRLEKQGNTVIICGRSSERLEAAGAKNPKLIPYACDISDPASCIAMIDWIKRHYPQLNVLINNAAISHATNFLDDADVLDKAVLEVATNFMAPLRLIKAAFPLLEEQNSAAVINITTGLVYAPRAAYPIYNATKAALHSFTQVLRLQAAASKVEVIEVQFPAVDTPWHHGNPPKIAISVEQAVDEMIAGLEKGKQEIQVGGVKLLHALTRVAPDFALRKINSL